MCRSRSKCPCNFSSEKIAHWQCRLPKFAVFLLVTYLGAFCFKVRSEPVVAIRDPSSLVLPDIGVHSMTVLSPLVLELTLVNTKGDNPARVPSWEFVQNDYSLVLPDPLRLLVTADSKPIQIASIGFKRRPLYAPLKTRDLRVGNYLYVGLASPLTDGQVVKVENPTKDLWDADIQFTAVVDPLRRNPAIHANQVGYMPHHPKRAMVGYYLGSMGELVIPTARGFEILEARTGLSVYKGTMQRRVDRGYTYRPAPYQEVYEADFSDFQEEGQYRLLVPGMGTSLPFRIDQGTAAAFARTFALGLYHQRCGTAMELPFTRHVHQDCHTAPADVPTIGTQFSKVQEFLSLVSSEKEERQTAVQLKDVDSSLYPFVKNGKIDVSGGHHDAGDYSKYTINSAGLIHALVFAADSFSGAGALDNLGIPESGDGKSDLLQEAKWEADFLAKMQDEDGGFYFLVYPRDRRYEDDVLPDAGDPQVVWPKNTAATAAAIAALAEAASSPRMRKEFPTESAMYLSKAERGWRFLMNSIARYGKGGAYQKMTHYGNEFTHDDELAWAAAAMYAATGEPSYAAKLIEWFPNPNSMENRRWDWWRMFEGYGSAVRTYAFAARSGRLAAASLDSNYLAKCEGEILAAAEDHVRFAQQNAYGSSFPDLYKQNRSAGWYFSSERAFDLTVAYQLTNRAAFVETVVGNINYEAGCNPLNMTFVTGIGLKRQREIVHQYAQNDRRVLPPSGFPLGNIQSGFAYLYHYTTELTALTYPPDNASIAPYPYYDRWSDSFNTTTEFVVTDQARSLASLSFWMAQSSSRQQEWRGIEAQIVGLPDEVQAGTTVNLSLLAPGIDFNTAEIVWEVQCLQPGVGDSYSLTPKHSGAHWIEAEALLPDGRRLFAVSNFVASTAADSTPNSFQSAALPLSADMVALYHLDGDLSDAALKQPPLTLKGNASLDRSNQGWINPHAGGAIRFYDLGDSASAPIYISGLNSSATAAIELEAMIYVNEFRGYNRGVARILSLNETWNAYVELSEDTYQGVFAKGGTSFSLGGSSLKQKLTVNEWHHIRISITRAGYAFAVDGVLLASGVSGELSNWGRAQFANLEIGNFDGWIDEVVVRVAKDNLTPLPSVRFTSPGNPVVSYAPATIPLRVEASAYGSAIQSVEFFAGATKIGKAIAAPFEIMWETIKPGTYSVSARVLDISGKIGVSAPIEVRIAAAASNARLLPLGTVASGGLRMLLMGERGSTYAIQASHDHQNWNSIGLIVLAGDASEFVDFKPRDTHKFYRAVQLR